MAGRDDAERRDRCERPSGERFRKNSMQIHDVS
jgi:hypothetical protein